MTIMKDKVLYFLAGLCALAFIAWPAPARADDCPTAIKAEVTSLCGSYKTGTLSIDLTGLPGMPKIGPVQCSASGPQRTVVFVTTAAPAPKKPPPLSGALPIDPSYASSWTPETNPACPNVGYAVYGEPSQTEVSTGSTQPSPSPNLKKLRTALTAPLPEDRTQMKPKHSLAAIRSYRSEVATSGTPVDVVPGDSTGAFDSAVAETLQILGQIVADRATAQAYTLIKGKLMELLQCTDQYTSTAGFNATCKVLGPLRLQDLAQSRQALFAAFVNDALAIIEKTRPYQQAMGPILGTLTTGAIIPLVAAPHAVLDDSVIRKVIDAIVTYADKALPEDLDQLTPEEEVVAVGVEAYLLCITPETGIPLSKALTNCDVSASVTKLAGAHTNIIPAALALAQDLVFIATPGSNGSDLRPRIVRAADVVFDASCMLLRSKGVQTLNSVNLGVNPAASTPAAFVPSFSCTLPTGEIQTPQDALALAQPIVDDAINGDTNALIAAIVDALVHLNQTLASQESKRVFALIGGLLDYASTYTSPAKGATDSSLHDQRTKILESLTQDMTDRTGREGDVVVSLGGSLRFVGGTRIGITTKSASFFGPVSLPLGLAITQIPRSSGCHCGFHMEIDAFDLGQYLSWDNQTSGPHVATPTVQDAIAPSITLGVAVGPTMPFVFGVTAGYSPSFAPDTTMSSAKGTFNIGAIAGVHVPLLDAN
jgi:hypothetical protein